MFKMYEHELYYNAREVEDIFSTVTEVLKCSDEEFRWEDPEKIDFRKQLVLRDSLAPEFTSIQI